MVLTRRSYSRNFISDTDLVLSPREKISAMRFQIDAVQSSRRRPWNRSPARDRQFRSRRAYCPHLRRPKAVRFYRSGFKCDIKIDVSAQNSGSEVPGKLGGPDAMSGRCRWCARWRFDYEICLYLRSVALPRR